jgi:hypothetical protein
VLIVVEVPKARSGHGRAPFKPQPEREGTPHPYSNAWGARVIAERPNAPAVQAGLGSSTVIVCFDDGWAPVGAKIRVRRGNAPICRRNRISAPHTLQSCPS